MDTTTSRFDTAGLGPLRKLVAHIPALRAAIGDIVTFRLIVDANFVIQELIHRIRRPQYGPTAFEELVKATVLDAYAPRWLAIEMVTAIPKAAKRSKVSEADLCERWAEFQPLLKWDDELCQPDTASSGNYDPKDVPYILLEQKLNAVGILTKDAHIARMGGHPLTLDFVFTTRNYARSAVTDVSIRVMGVMIPTVTTLAAVELLRRIGRGIAALPGTAKGFLLIGALIALLHPTSRKWIADRCSDAYALTQAGVDALLEIAQILAATSKAAELQASTHLREATKAIRPKRDVGAIRPRGERLRSRSELSTNSPVVVNSERLPLIAP